MLAPVAMQPLDAEQTAARAWFELWRDLIRTGFVAIECEAGSDAVFDYLAKDRIDPSGGPGGGANLNPPLPVARDIADCDVAFEALCDAHPVGDCPRFSNQQTTGWDRWT